MKHLRELRDRAGLTQRELGVKVGVAEITVRKWEAGERTPRPRRLARIARALRVAVGELA